MCREGDGESGVGYLRAIMLRSSRRRFKLLCAVIVMGSSVAAFVSFSSWISLYSLATRACSAASGCWASAGAESCAARKRVMTPWYTVCSADLGGACSGGDTIARIAVRRPVALPSDSVTELSQR